MGDVKSILENEFYSFDIIQLIQVIKEILSDSIDDDTNEARIFFEADPSLAFPSSDVSAVEISGYSDDGKCGNNGINEKYATVRFPIMNLLGSSSPLPIKFSDYITRNSPDAEVYRDFLSIMQNRLHTLWIDAHQKCALWSDTGKTAKKIFGLMTAFPSGQANFFNDALPHLGTFSRQTRSAADLKLLLRSTWKNIPVRIEENIGRLAPVANRLPLGGGLRLSRGATMGTKIFDCASKFRISLGPLEYKTYHSFLPGENNHKHLQNLITLYLNEPLICELEISCERSNLPSIQIGGVRGDSGCLGRAAVLGRPVSGRRSAGLHRYRTVINE
ncbi:MAG: type VI secretion system baseplate subunit TssG [Chitinispirillales bacterium]|jgi:type VI secretion system protein ImpH|nr:type VI secretion system baseplate subunit TssG [Chitinispirillales bacterium]